jgi:hypothetical protein
MKEGFKMREEKNYKMTKETACEICSDICNPDIKDRDKALATHIILEDDNCENLPKEVIVECLRWAWNQKYEWITSDK